MHGHDADLLFARGSLSGRSTALKAIHMMSRPLNGARHKAHRLLLTHPALNDAFCHGIGVTEERSRTSELQLAIDDAAA